MCQLREFDASFESIWHLVANLWQKNGKISGCFIAALSLFFNNVKIKQIWKEMVVALHSNVFCTFKRVNGVIF